MGFLLLIKSVQIFATKNITQVSGTEKEKRKKQAGGRRKKKGGCYTFNKQTPNIKSSHNSSVCRHLILLRFVLVCVLGSQVPLGFSASNRLAKGNYQLI